MERAYKFRLYPNKQQEELINKTFGCCRYVFNYYLAYRKELYETSGETANYYVCSKDLTQLKSSLEWLKEVDATALQSSLRDLDDAYNNFFRRIKQGAKPGYPKFKSKHNHKQSYKSKNTGATIKVLDNAVQLPKLGRVKCRGMRDVEGRILSATVIRNAAGHYYVSICCTDVEIEPLPKNNKSIGIDMGIKYFAVTSDGVRFANHKYLAQSQKKLARLQRQLSRKTKGSANYEKARIKVAKLHEHIVDQRKDMLHKLSTELIRDYDVICIEDLDISEMLQRRIISRDIADASWGEFKRQLVYKAGWYGKQIVDVDRYFSANQICSECGTKWNSSHKTICPECGTKHDRNVNSAKNILNEGLRVIA